MDETRRIPEAEYAEDLAGGLNAIAEAIARSGLPLAAIARATRMRWGTVYHAAHGIQVRYDSARRIMYYLNSLRNANHTDQAR